MRAGKASNGLTVARELLYAKITAPIFEHCHAGSGRCLQEQPLSERPVSIERRVTSLYISADFCPGNRNSLYVIIQYHEQQFWYRGGTWGGGNG